MSVLLTRDLSGLHHKVLTRRRTPGTRGGYTRGAATPLVGGAGGIDASQRFLLARSVLPAWGEPALPGFPPEGETGKGETKFLAAAGELLHAARSPFATGSTGLPSASNRP